MSDAPALPEIIVDPASSVPPFEQVRTQIIDAVAAGRLAAGARLPAVRRLAEELGLAAGTVARAYKELEAAGFVATLGRNGTVVSPQGDPARRRAQSAAAEFAQQMRSLRVDDAQALALVAAALRSGGTASTPDTAAAD